MTHTRAGRKQQIERIGAREARLEISNLMNRARFGGERFVITRNGEDFVLLVGIQDAGDLLDVA